MMEYAPNGDLFVSSPSTNSIFVLRDANHDGVFEGRSVLPTARPRRSDAGEDCRRAAILETNRDGTDARIYASGIRNPVGLTLQPGTDVVWTATNERDNLGDDLVPDYATSNRPRATQIAFASSN